MDTEKLSDGRQAELDPIPAPGSVWKLILGPFIGIAVVMGVAYFATIWAFPDKFVVDYYPASKDTPEQPPIAVIRWPSQQLQLKPIELPRSLASDPRCAGKAAEAGNTARRYNTARR